MIASLSDEVARAELAQAAQAERPAHQEGAEADQARDQGDDEIKTDLLMEGGWRLRAVT